MGKVFNPPCSIKVPEFNTKDINGYKKDVETFIQAVKDYCKKNSKDKYAGEMVTIPMGDGVAQYIILSTKPVQLIHLDVWDGWDSNMVDQLSAKWIKDHVDGKKKLQKLFGK